MPLDYIEDKDIAGNAASSILGVAKAPMVATGADMVATLYNSTIGHFTEDIKTRDILSKADQDALAFYDQHREGVEAASFMGGIVVPQAATLKLLGMVKNGVSVLGKTNSLRGAVADVFSGTKAQALETDLRVLFEGAKYDTPLYNRTMRRLYAAKIGENAIDAAIFEGVAVGTLNAHPYMEDYMESPYSNFALWATVGGGLGSALGVIQARSSVRDALGMSATKAVRTVAEAYRPVNIAMPNAAQIQTHNITIGNLEAIISVGENDITKQIANEVLTNVKAQREARILDAAPWLEGEGKKVSEYIDLKPAIEDLLSKPEMMGVDTIKLPNMKFIPKGPGEKLKLEFDMLQAPTKETRDAIAILEDQIAMSQKWLANNPEASELRKMHQSTLEHNLESLDNLKKEGSKFKTVFYRPSTGDLYDRNLAGASALAVDLKDWKPAPKTVNLHDPNKDFFLELASRGKPTAVQDAEYLNELSRWSTVKASEVEHIGISPSNLARLNAATTWLSKVSPELRESIRFNLVNDLPSFNQTVKFIESGAAGVGRDYMPKLQRIMDNESLHLMDRLGNSKESAFLAGWKQDVSIGSFRRAFDSFFRGTDLPRGEEGNIALARKIWEAGKDTRDELRKIADKDGNIYLYRGIKGQVKGHAPVEGYTDNPRVASGFGTARLFKVPVENVIGRIGGRGFSKEREILVVSPHHEIVNDIPVATGENKAVVIPGAKSQNTMNGVELVQHYTNETQRQIQELIADRSFSAEEIAARTNTTKEAVLLVGMGRELDEIPNWRRYVDDQLIQSEYLNKKNRIVALQGNPYAVNPVKLSASLDDRFLSAAHQQFVELTTAKHKASLADAILDFYNPLSDEKAAKEMRFQLDQLKQNIGEINNILIKSPLFQSVDMALRNIKNGPIVTYIGKRVSDITDKAIERLLKPVGLGFKGLNNNPAALAEFNLVDNKLASLAGWREIRVDEETGYRYIVQREIREKQQVEVPVKNKDGSVFFIKSKEVINALEGTREASAEILKMHNLNRELRGQAPLNDLGFYLPPTNLVNKHYSYVIDNTGKMRPSLLIANTAEELAGLEAAYKAEVLVKNPTLEIVAKSSQEDYNLIKGYTDAEAYTEYANNQLKHSGAIATAIVPADARRVDGIMQGYEHQIIAGMRKYNEMYLNDITQKLDALSKVNQRLYADQPLRGFFKKKAEDAATTVKNTLLAVNNLGQFTTWKSVNEFVDMAIVRTGRALDGVASTFSNTAGSKEHFDEINRELTQKGITPAWESFQMYQASLLGAPTVNSRRAIAAANGLMGTLQLRLLELAHPLVNAISTPILASGALMEGLPGTTLANGVTVKFPLRIMYDAARFQFNPKGIEMIKQWEAAGYLDQVVRQYTDIIGKTHVPVATKGAANEVIDKLEAFQNSRAVELLTKPADFTEKFTRQFAMSQGYLMAKHAYPGISDRGATIYAVAIADRVIGNYHAAQRPGLFQGTFGAVLGLYQTYMTTFAQHVYRGIENRNFKALATTMLAQAGIFGTASWPGYDTLSKFIGEHMSNQNFDLTTGTYRAVGDPMAEVILYGLPSTLGPTLYTRGDIAPRIPSQMTDLAVVNSTVGIYNAVSKMISNVATQPGFQGKLQGMMEALSLQTVSRPIARAAEIVSGESITRKGQTVATSDDVWTFNGIFSRLLAVRPLEEQVTRNALQLHSYYGAADFDNRQKAVNKLRTAIRAGKMDDDLVEQVALDYLHHGGSNKGWNAVMNEIMTRTEEGTSFDLLRKLEPDSPLRRMIKDTF